MGGKCCSECPLSKEELDEYAFLTYLSRSEIVACFRKFRSVDPVSVDLNRDVRLPISKILDSVAPLRMNSFGDLFCRAFSCEKDDKMCFDDFLDLYNVMSSAAPTALKTHFAFKVFDVDGDGAIGREDLMEVVSRQYHVEEKHLTVTEKAKIADKILDEVDIDRDRVLCKSEFRFALERIGPEFRDAFYMYY